jgi:uncharacterized protein (TIGR02001 family)
MPPATPIRTTTACLAWLLLSTTPSARAEIGGTVAVQSDARERGLSYSQDKPQGQVTVALDDSSGWYGGGLLTRTDFGQHRSSTLLRSYIGRVVRLSPGLDAEAGLQYNRYLSIARYDFAEAYVGLLADRWSTRLYFSDDYYGNGERSVYGEVNLNWPLRHSLMAIAHVGTLHGPGGEYPSPHGNTRIDTRLGLAWQLRPFELQLSWVTASLGGPFTWTTERRRNTAVLSLSASF